MKSWSTAPNAFGQFPIKHGDLDCDYYGTSLHKWVLAPIGTGFLYVRKNKIPSIWPMMAAPPELNDNIRKFEEIGTHPASQRRCWSTPLRQLPGVRILNSDDPEQSCDIGFISVDGFDAPKLAAHLWQKYRIWTAAVVTPGEYQGLRITPNV